MEKFPKQNNNGELGINKMPDHFKETIREKMKEYSSFMDPVMAKLSESDAKYIGMTFALSEDYKEGYLYSVDVLSKMMGIKTPQIEFELVPDGSNAPPALYLSKTNTIRIFRKENDTQKEKGIVRQIKGLSHEMWHAYQHNEVRSNGPGSGVYKNNFEHYISGKDDLEGYFNQPIELEAYTFSTIFTNKVIDLTKMNLEKEHEKLIAEIALNVGDEETLDEDFFRYKEKIESRLKELENW